MKQTFCSWSRHILPVADDKLVYAKGFGVREAGSAAPWTTRQFGVADLLAQRSSLPYSALTHMMPYDHARKDIIKALRFVEPVSSFRSAFAYQNAFHLVFEDIVARLAGTESWEAFLRAELLDPLGMSSSSYDAQSMDIGTSVALEPWSGDVFIANAELPAHGAGPIADGAFPDASTPRV